MQQSLLGRPTKGRRMMSRVSVSAANTTAVSKLCRRHGRQRPEILAALLTIGLSHPDEFPAAVLRWASTPVSMPADVDVMSVDGLDDGPTAVRIRLPELHHNAIESFVDSYPGTGPNLRAALTWIGLHHVAELDHTLGELDDFQRRLTSGRSLGDYYVDTTTEYFDHQMYAPGTVLTAIRELRSGVKTAAVAKATGLPSKLLTALSVEAVSEIDGRLPLTG